jgi:hypothetical protein
MTDMVNHPEHYTHGAVECIDAIEASMSADGFAGFCKGNAVKYLWRYERKGHLQDLEKADWYLKRLRHSLLQQMGSADTQSTGGTGE